MIERQGIINNAFGIHCRPADIIRKAADGFQGKLEIVGADGTVANPHKILSILTLALTKGDHFIVRAEGPGEEEIADKLVSLLETSFDFQ